MASYKWSEDYASTYKTIDAEHKDLFEMLNLFEDTYDTNASSGDVLAFLEMLIRHCHKHFKHEDEIMEIQKYPLNEYHRGVHVELLNGMLQCLAWLKENIVKNPYDEALKLSAKLYNHVMNDDLTIFSYIKHKHLRIGSNIIGRPCEIYTMDNKLLNYGKVSGFGDEFINVECKNKIMAIGVNDFVRISVVMFDKQCNYFVARLHNIKGNEMRLYNNMLIKTVNDREYFRISTHLNAKILIGEENPVAADAIIDDISAGGLQIKTEHTLLPEDFIKIEFEVNDKKFSERCRVRRELKKEDNLHHYGIQFVSLEKSSHDKLMQCIMFLQSKHVATIR